VTRAPMDARVARNIAHSSHNGQRDRFGEPLIDHVERVAGVVPPDARAVAYLHDVLEHSSVEVKELRLQGLTPVESGALELLTRSSDESFELHALRIAHARGPEGVLARKVKLADLNDHLARDELPYTAPPYAWARRHISRAEGRPGSTGLAA
jgi:hypothetical protein